MKKGNEKKGTKKKKKKLPFVREVLFFLDILIGNIHKKKLKKKRKQKSKNKKTKNQVKDTNLIFGASKGVGIALKLASVL